MNFLKKTGIIVFAMSLCINGAFARSATDEEVKSLQVKIETIKPGMQKDDIDTVISTMPTSIFKSMSEMGPNLTEDQVREGAKTAMKALYSQAKTQSWEMDFDKRKPCELDNGDPCFVIPVAQTMTVGEKTLKIEMPMIAVQENGEWYFVNTAEPQTLPILKKLFPGIEKIKLDETKASEL